MNFLKFLEKRKYIIKVALHPKNNKKNNRPFGIRKYYKNQTALAIKHSCGAITHDSNAISFAVLNNKPLIFITTSDLDNSRFGKRIRYHSKFFGCKPINIDYLNKNKFYFPIIDKKVYFNYINKFLKHEKFKSKNHFKNFFLRLIKK